MLDTVAIGAERRREVFAVPYQPPYPEEFRRRAVELVRTSDLSLRAGAQDLGVSIESLRLWVKQAEIDEGCRQGLTTEERAELKALRAENRRLKMEREILQKAEAFFAKETDATR